MLAKLRTGILLENLSGWSKLKFNNTGSDGLLLHRIIWTENQTTVQTLSAPYGHYANETWMHADYMPSLRFMTKPNGA